ncbi:MAG: hypothetical protein GYB68_10985 [Chloroflexi bacterium]|nr:hypothetical protein [Chloroflexota bacterium]
MIDLLLSIAPLLNLSLSAAIAIIAGSFLLYGLTTGTQNRVKRVFSVLLATVTITYIGDLGVAYSGTDVAAAEFWLRFQWIGIAYVPAVYAHLSDAILELTGLPSRGRRRRAVIMVYVIATSFLAMGLWSDAIVSDLRLSPAPHFGAGPWFWLFFTYFAGAVATSFWFVVRARKRSLTRSTRQRLSLLLFTYAAPALAVFPFLLLAGRSFGSALLFYGMVIIVGVMLAVMLSAMAYLMAFFGAVQPDRMIRARMLQFFARGPLVAIILLVVIQWVPTAGAVLGLPGDVVMPFIAVATLLFLQWAITIVKPVTERWLIYADDRDEIRKIQDLEARLLTGTDFRQLLDTLLASACDYLQVQTAFVASLPDNGPVLERSIGLDDELTRALTGSALSFDSSNGGPEDQNGDALVSIFVDGDQEILQWHSIWLMPLRSQLDVGADDQIIGLLGVAVPRQEGQPQAEPDPEQWGVLRSLAMRSAEILEDRRLQAEVFASLDGLLPQIAAVQRLRGAAWYGDIEALTMPTDVMVDSDEFADMIKGALKHYWGGPRLTETSLLTLAVVRQALDENDGNPQRAMRAVLQQALENLRPEGERSMTTSEWIFYNILEMRFIQGRKVKDVALRLAMSETDLYRKQKDAILEVARIIADMERSTLAGDLDSLQPDGEMQTSRSK